MNLKHHLALQMFLRHAAVDVNHGNLDDVGSRTLNWGVHGIPFGKGTHRRVVRVDVGNIPATSENRLNISVLPCRGESVFDEI